MPGGAIDFATKAFGRVDILVNNAGTNIKERTLRELTTETWDMMIGANLNGAFYCTKAVLPQMLGRKDGIIVNVVSVAGKAGKPTRRGGLRGGKSSAWVRHRMVPGRKRKTAACGVGNIYPGEIDTPILAAHDATRFGGTASGLKPEDVAEAVLLCRGACPREVSVPELVIKPTAQLCIGSSGFQVPEFKTKAKTKDPGATTQRGAGVFVLLWNWNRLEISAIHHFKDDAGDVVAGALGERAWPRASARVCISSWKRSPSRVDRRARHR
ncbi:MAG: SDR family NAD(P)-dependent oxidoreductase [Gemmataceae bacterium]